MSVQADLDYFMTLMKNFHIPVYRFTPDALPRIDDKLEQLISYENGVRERFRAAKPNTLYYVSDAFSFCYCYLLLPDGEEILLVGPYLCREVPEQEIMSLMEQHHLPTGMLSVVKNCYSSAPLVQSADMMFSLLTTLGECLWGGAQAYSVEYVEDTYMMHADGAFQQIDVTAAAEAVDFMAAEKRYEGERDLLYLISQGMVHRAQKMIDQVSERTLESRSADPLRNLKNYGVVCNTLMRKAVESGGVHPLYIDRLSSSMARKIEMARSGEECRKLFSTMVHKYCLLVKNYSMKGYSQLVQHVILRVEADLTADLSLKAHAKALSVNPSYLSTLFKREMGVTLTEYVNRKRMDNAIFLLNATDMQVQTIAQYCGIPDVNYFTKTFKRMVGKTPKEYRAQTKGGK